MSIATQLAELKLEVASLRAEVARQADRIARLELEGSAGEEFELVVSEPAGSSRPSVAAGATGAASEALLAREPPTEEERRAVAREVGRFLRAQLDGQLSGPSGRDKIALPNRVYVVCRDIEGKLYNPPLVLERFYEVRNICKRGTGFGSSVFVGLPSKWEARVAVEAASLRWGS